MNNRNKKSFTIVLIVAIVFLITALVSNSLFSQTTTNEIIKTSDSTFVEKQVTIHPNGRIVTMETPYNSKEFAERVVRANIEKSIQIDNRTAQNQNDQRDVNLFRRYVIDSLKINADSILNEKLLVALEGDWKLLVRGKSDDNRYDVTIDKNPNNPILLRMRGEGANYNVRALNHNQAFEVRGFLVNNVAENVPMKLTVFDNFTGYRGVASDGSVLVLRR